LGFIVVTFFLIGDFFSEKGDSVILDPILIVFLGEFSFFFSSLSAFFGLLALLLVTASKS
jgi:hypothetical protein